MQWFNMVQVLALVLVATTSGIAASNSSGLSTSATAAAWCNRRPQRRSRRDADWSDCSHWRPIEGVARRETRGRRRDDDEEVQSEPKYNADGTVVVSKYYKNGVKQRLAHWWNSLVSQRPARRLREA
ncbi:unnamed protein product [Hyaloperonospora brassicae]|uniref:RxLR effector candidate protein n=1 Tax=Hyaloperonospora brassicae TaxID=162125 RepID=A0AAV0U8F0_HYABA|nr:unnamed protein product [Hyaloperonospora brassicae]